jgi:hypothetical protein
MTPFIWIMLKFIAHGSWLMITSLSVGSPSILASSLCLFHFSLWPSASWELIRYFSLANKVTETGMALIKDNEIRCSCDPVPGILQVFPFDRGQRLGLEKTAFCFQMRTHSRQVVEQQSILFMCWNGSVIVPMISNFLSRKLRSWDSPFACILQGQQDLSSLSMVSSIGIRFSFNVYARCIFFHIKYTHKGLM